MLTAMRKKGKFLNILLWLVIIAFLATIFFVWGMGDDSSRISYVARIGDDVVTVNEYQTASEQVKAQMKAYFGAQADTLLENDKLLGQNILNTLIDNHLLLLEAARLKLPISNGEVIGFITNQLYFQNDGQFDINIYQQILASQGLTPTTYEEQVRQQITVNKLRMLVAGSVAVTEREVVEEYKYRQTNHNISYFTLTSEAYKPAHIDDDALNKYFQENIEQYRQPARIKLKYISFNVDSFPFKFVAPSENELRAKYTAEISRFTSAERKVTPFERAKPQLLKEMEVAAKQSAFRNHIYGLSRDITNAGNITAYIEKNPDAFKVALTEMLSQDDKSAFFKQDAELERTLFGMEKTDVSPLMDVGGRVYLYEMFDKVPSALPELKQVYKRAVNDWTEAVAFSNMIAVTAQADDFNVLAGKLKAKSQTISNVRQTDTAKLQANDGFLSAVIARPVGEIIRYPVQQTGRIYVAKVDSVKAPNMKALDEEKPALVQYLTGVKQEEVMKDFLAGLRKRYKVTLNPDFTL
ncbi:hypothetical protein RsTz2092_10510 [Deferribacterales bacterium RsTz2092]|nr:hypothetical protein AGMMS49941_11140 [Deferribacterales bacterium]